MFPAPGAPPPADSLSPAPRPPVSSSGPGGVLRLLFPAEKPGPVSPLLLLTLLCFGRHGGALPRERLLGPPSTGGGEAVCPASEERRPSAGAEAKKARSGPSCVPPPPLALPLLQTAQRPPFSLRSRPPQTRRRSAAKGGCFEKPEAEPEAHRLWPRCAALTRPVQFKEKQHCAVEKKPFCPQGGKGPRGGVE